MFKLRLGLGIFLLAIPLCKGQEVSLFSFSKPAMGTLYHLHFYANDEKKAQKISDLAFERILELDGVLSDYKETAEVYQLNYSQPTSWINISDDLAFVLRLSIKWSKETKGKFDPALGSLTQLWRRARRRNEYPADSLQMTAKNFSGVQFISLRKWKNAYQFKFNKKGVKLDFGGIGKGYAVDEALNILVKNGFNRSMSSAGSSVALGDPPPDKLGWLIVSENELILNTQERFLKNIAQSISGDESQFLEWEGNKYSHLLDPLTGKPLTNGITCLVEGKNALETDVLGTAISSMNAVDIRKLIGKDKKRRAICKSKNSIIKYNWE